MLVLTRKKDETILIGDDIELVVTKIKSGAVTLGIAAPKDVKILRGEIAGDESKRSVVTLSG